MGHKQWRIGTRGSELALRQTEIVIAALKRVCADIDIRPCIIQTHGDSWSTGSSPSLGETGIFTKAIEQELTAGRIDLAAHSMKDLPTELTAGLMVGAVLVREDPADVLISKHAGGWQGLPFGAKVMTGSLRRGAQLRHLRPEVKVTSVRGNVPTRLRKLHEGDADAMIIAWAGLKRLGLEPAGCTRLDPLVFTPACGQGAIAVEIRADDQDARQLVHAIDDPLTRQAVAAEREYLRILHGGCSAPAGAYARMENGLLVIDAMLADANGRQVIRTSQRCPIEQAEAIGRLAAEDILGRGGEEILQTLKKDISDP